MSFLKDLLFLLKKPSVILVTGKGRACTKEAISKILKAHLKGAKALLFESDLKESADVDKFNFFFRHSKQPILLVSHIGEIPPDRYFFDGERRETSSIRKIARISPTHGFLILNFDDETVREIKNESLAHPFTYGFQQGADFRATDVNVNLEGTNFKINYQGNTVPFWLRRIFGKEQIYSVLAAIAIGVIKDLNLVEMSQTLASYQSLPGKMRLIEGIKKSLILDDSENATALSMIEALEILGEIGKGQRKIAVLGDVLGAGKYTIEAHETIGEKVVKTADLLFAIGPRAKFIAQGARRKGMEEKNIFQFNETNKGKLRLQKEIKKEDIILIDGSKEMKMGEVIQEIKMTASK